MGSGALVCSYILCVSLWGSIACAGNESEVWRKVFSSRKVLRLGVGVGVGVGRMFTFARMIGWELALHATYFLECIG